jgi:hypothetical protein
MSSLPFVFRRASLVAVLALVGIADRSDAQQGRPLDAGRRALSSRADLEAVIAADERSAAGASGARRDSLVFDADAIRRRLAQGDFVPGDRLLLRVGTEAARTDTVTVNRNTAIGVAGIPDVSLIGVLRSELDDHLTREISHFVKGATAHGAPLLLIGVFGAVLRPGYYLHALASPMTDAMMSAGGPTADADPRGIEVHRNGVLLHSRADVVAAIQEGATFSGLDMHGGDLVTVAKMPLPFDRASAFQVGGLVLQAMTVMVTIYIASRR